MNINKISSQELKEAIRLLEEKESLQAKILEIDQQLAALLDGAAAGQSGEPAKHVDSAENFKVSRKVKTGKRGQVKEAILSVLKQAGTEGITLKEIAKAVGKNVANINTWLHSTGKKFKAIKKLGRGIYGWQE